MRAQRIRVLEWGYPLFLWLIVAFFTVLAVADIARTRWNPAQISFAPGEDGSFELVKQPAPTVKVVDSVVLALY